jgi:hypothetical protein
MMDDAFLLHLEKHGFHCLKLLRVQLLKFYPCWLFNALQNMLDPMLGGPNAVSRVNDILKLQKTGLWTLVMWPVHWPAKGVPLTVEASLNHLIVVVSNKCPAVKSTISRKHWRKSAPKTGSWTSASKKVQTKRLISFSSQNSTGFPLAPASWEPQDVPVDVWGNTQRSIFWKIPPAPLGEGILADVIWGKKYEQGKRKTRENVKETGTKEKEKQKRGRKS